MEDNNNKRGKQGNVNGSVILSFAVAIFAIVSIAMGGISLTQNSGISYAAPTTLPDNFTFNLLDGGAHVKSQDSTGSKEFNVPLYVANNDANNPIFCIEHAVGVVDNTNYTADEDEDDYGLLYILNNSYANGVKVTNETGEDAKYVEAWVTQTAIWMYLYESEDDISPSSVNYIEPEDLAAIKSATKLTLLNEGVAEPKVVYNGANLYNTYVKQLVENAMGATDVAYLNISKAGDAVSLSEDKKFYFSSLITVTGDPSSSLKSFSVKLSGIDGAKAIDEDGNEISDNVAPGTKFYVRIPAEKVTKSVQKVVVSVNGLFTTLEGKQYTGILQAQNPDEDDEELQVVVSVKAGEKTISRGTEVEFVGTDDTGMNTVQTIYFIGLIVLLCGVGIVYANAKPVQVKQ